MSAEKTVLPKGDITTSQLAIGMVNGADIPSLITEIITIQADINLALATFNNLKSNLDAQVLNGTSNIAALAKGDPATILKSCLSQISPALKQITEDLYTATIQGATGAKINATVLGQKMKFGTMFSNVSFFENALFSQPQSIALHKTMEYWNKNIANFDPSERDLYFLQVNGFKKWDDYVESFRKNEGLSLDDAKRVAEMHNWQYGVPSLREAWIMVQRGLWKKSDWLSLAKYGQAFTTDDAEALYKLYAYDPTIGDVMSLFNLIPLDPIWINQKFDRTGMSAADKAIFLAGMNKSVILREIRQIWAQILSVYQYGMFTKTEITTLLEGWQFPQAEINIKVQTAELVKGKLVNSLMRDADIYLYRKNVITACDLYERLLAQQIPTDVCNALTRNEACKQGDDWELSSCTP